MLAALYPMPYDALMIDSRQRDYLTRVGLSRFPAATEKGLRELHAAQVFRIPFENLTPLLGEPVSTGLDTIFEKVVKGARGGYCFELNGLFAWALGTAGFEFQICLARVQVQKPEPGPHTHQVSIVKINGREWIADVGFGGPGLRYPVLLEVGHREMQDGEEYRISQSEDYGFCLEHRPVAGEWTKLYHFRKQKVLPVDILMGNHFTSTWPQAIFRNALIVARPFPGGQRTVFGREFKVRDAAGARSEKIYEPERMVAVLREHFGIELSAHQREKLGPALASQEPK